MNENKNRLNAKNFPVDILALLDGLRPGEENTNVFTPQKVVNEMLDMLPKEIWKSSTVKFLDPVCKSGIFLREIAKRLVDAQAIDANGNKLKGRERLPVIRHILQNQIYGIATTEEAAIISRRTVYGSQRADSRYSLSEFKDSAEGNIRYRECSSRNEKRKEAYPFLDLNIYEIFGENMNFDVIIGNPPYQENVGIQAKAFGVNIFNLFVDQARNLQPNYLTMIIPSKWFSGDRGLDAFRNSMLNDTRIQIIHDFFDASECFPPSVEIKGGVCYFLWNKEYHGDCVIYSHENGHINKMKRPLLENGGDVFIRYNKAISILHKVEKSKETNFSSLVSVQTPFGLVSSFSRFHQNNTGNEIKVYAKNKQQGFLDSAIDISKNQNCIDKWKVYVPKAVGSGKMKDDWLNPIIGEPHSVCTQTYLMFGPFEDKRICENVISYTQTKFFHFLWGLKKVTQDGMRDTYSFIPLQDFSKPWTDAELYAKYTLTEEEIAFIESMVKPLE